MSAVLAAAPDISHSAADIAKQAREANDAVLERQRQRAEESSKASSFVENHFGAIVAVIIIGIVVYAVYRFYANIGGFFSNGINSAGASLTGAAQGIFTGASNAVNTAGGDIQGVYSGGSNTLNNVGGDIQNVGEQIDKGLSNGINTLGSDVQNAGAGLSKWLGSHL